MKTSRTLKNGELSLMKHDQFSFLEHRRQQEAAHHKRLSNEPIDPLNSILTVEVNTTELCNRTCVFCPRHDPKVFPNRNLHMTPKGAESISKELARNYYRGKISLSGFGENLLNPEFPEIIKSSGFDIEEIDSMYLPSTPKFAGFNYWGFAKHSS